MLHPVPPIPLVAAVLHEHDPRPLELERLPVAQLGCGLSGEHRLNQNACMCLLGCQGSMSMRRWA